MTKFNHRAFMSVAGIAAAETVFSPLVSARTNRSDAIPAENAIRHECL
jgi:hypothetical protein